MLEVGCSVWKKHLKWVKAKTHNKKSNRTQKRYSCWIHMPFLEQKQERRHTDSHFPNAAPNFSRWPSLIGFNPACVTCRSGPWATSRLERSSRLGEPNNVGKARANHPPKVPYAINWWDNQNMGDLSLLYHSISENQDISLGVAMVWTLDCSLNSWTATKNNLLKGEIAYQISWQPDPKGFHMARMQFMYNFNNPMDTFRQMQPWLSGLDTSAALF